VSERPLKVRLKTARQRTASSQRWLERQLNDPYVAAARHEGYRSRAAFKLIELDERFHLLKRGARIVDLGAAPGGWTQIAAQRARADDGAVVRGARQDRQPPQAVLDAMARAAAQRSLCGAREARRDALAGCLQADRDR